MRCKTRPRGGGERCGGQTETTERTKMEKKRTVRPTKTRQRTANVSRRREVSISVNARACMWPTRTPHTADARTRFTCDGRERETAHRHTTPLLPARRVRALDCTHWRHGTHTHNDIIHIGARIHIIAHTHNIHERRTGRGRDIREERHQRERERAVLDSVRCCSLCQSVSAPIDRLRRHAYSPMRIHTVWSVT
jgi:hypothetical protein